MRQGNSGLTLREFKVYSKPEVELTSRKVAQWAKNLPLANLGESSKSTYRMLVDINQQIVDPDKRLAIINIIEPIARELINSLEKQFAKNRIALSEKQRKIAALVQAIQTELSIAYHTVIESLIGEDVKRSQKKLMLNALVMATQYHGLVILRCYQLYASIPHRIWRELYNLYQIARKFELNIEPLQLERGSSKTSVHDSLTQILLLSIASPYQLRQREIDLLWHLLPDIVPFAELKTHAYNKHHYVIDLNSSAAPIHKSLYRPKDGKETLKLTATSALPQINSMLENIHGSDQYSTRKIMLFKHLIQCWNFGTHRAFARTGCEGIANISFGLNATHFYLSKEAQEEKTPQRRNRNPLEAMEGSLKDATISEIARQQRSTNKQAFDYLSSSSLPNEDVWAKLYKTDKEREYEAAREQMASKSNRSRDSIMRDSYKPQFVSLLNMSPNGYCIEINADELPAHAQTGEVLGFQEDCKDKSENWNIAVVKWVKRQAKGNLVQMGVQLLAPGATPINLQLRNSRSETNEYQKALILPALTGVGQPATILTNPLSFSTNSKVRVMENGQSYDARLSKELTATSNYRQFCFEKITSDKPQQASNSKNTNTLSGPEDFDGVWDLL